jgi:hypothetical protein
LGAASQLTFIWQQQCTERFETVCHFFLLLLLVLIVACCLHNVVVLLLLLRLACGLLADNIFNTQYHFVFTTHTCRGLYVLLLLLLSLLLLLLTSLYTIVH